MANPMRGEVEVVVDGKPHDIALTLGSLAEVEVAFGVDCFEQAIPQCFTAEGRVRAQKVVLFMRAVFKGNGLPVEKADRIPVVESARLLADLVSLSGLISEEGGSGPAGENPPAASAGEGG